MTLERATPAERAGVFTRAFGLSPREAELLRHLVAGSDSRELAARLSVSGNTVQDHLKWIFARTGFHSRRELLAHVFGVARDQEPGGVRQGAGVST